MQYLHFHFLLILFLNLKVQEPNQNIDVFHLKGEITNNTVQLKWNNHPLADYDSIQIFRARNESPLTLHKSIDVIAESFYDDSAIFGKYRYQLKGYMGKYSWQSKIVQVETYGGDDFTTLKLPEKVSPGYTFNLTLGNAKTNEKVWYFLFDTAGNSIISTEKTLSNQTFYLQTDGLATGTYIAMLRLENFDHFFNYKFTLENK